MQAIRSSPSPSMKHGQQFAFRGARMEHFGQRLTENGRKVETDWTFLRGMRVSVKPNVSRVASQGKCFSVAASCKPSITLAISRSSSFIQIYGFQVELRSCIWS